MSRMHFQTARSPAFAFELVELASLTEPSLVPQIVALRPETRVVPATAAAALTALAPTTILALHPPQPNALREMAALVRAVPCYTLELGSDVDRIPEAIAQILETPL